MTDRARQRMSRPDDARALRSREALQAAMLGLLEERQFHEFTIRDVTNRAGVSYPTFFRRYGTKEELLEDLAAGEVRRLLSATYPSLELASPEASLQQLCQYVNEHRQLWKSLLTTQAAGAMRNEFARLSADIGHDKRFGRMNPWLPVSLASHFVASGVFEILVWWLSQEDDYPIPNVVTFLMQLIVAPTLVSRKVALE
jgi:AcrR family transcriptional regulator